MFRRVFDVRVLKDPSWWHWALTIPLLAAHVSGYPFAIDLAIALCAIVTLYYGILLRQWRPFPVQVRLAYLILLLAGLIPGAGWIHWIQLAGTTTMVTVGYCPLARMLSLLWFNRREPLTFALVGRVILAPPGPGGVVHGHSVRKNDAAQCCTLRKEVPTCSVGSARG